MEKFYIGNQEIQYRSKYLLRNKLDNKTFKIEHKENDKVVACIEIELQTVENEKIEILQYIKFNKQKSYKKYKNELEVKLNEVLQSILIDAFDNLKLGENYCGYNHYNIKKENGWETKEDPVKVIINNGDLKKFARCDGKVIYIQDNLLFEKISLTSWDNKREDGMELIRRDLRNDYYIYNKEPNYTKIYFIGENDYYINCGKLL